MADANRARPESSKRDVVVTQRVGCGRDERRLLRRCGLRRRSRLGHFAALDELPALASVALTDLAHLATLCDYFGNMTRIWLLTTCFALHHLILDFHGKCLAPARLLLPPGLR